MNVRAAAIFRWGIRLILIGLALVALSQPGLAAIPDAVQRGDYRTALTAHAGDQAVWEKWLTASLSSNSPEQTEMILAHVAALSGWTAALRSETADLVAGQDVTGATVYRRALLAEQVTPDLLQAVFSADLTLHDWPDAIIQGERLLTLNPGDTDLRYQLAYLLAPDDPQAAAEDWTRAATDPKYAAPSQAAIQALTAKPLLESPRRLGLQAIGEERWSLAEYLLRRALAANGGDYAAMALLGLVEEQQGEDGSLLIQEALIGAPADPLVAYAAALHWQRTGNTDQALAALTKAEGNNPNNPALAAALGAIYRQRGSFGDAAFWLGMAVRLAPDNVGFAESLAALYADEHYALDSGGLVYIQSAVQHFPKDADLYASLGVGFLATGQTSAALDTLRTAVTLAPGTARVFYYYGTALEQSGDVSDAVTAYLSAYRAPDSPDGAFRDLAGRALERLNYRPG